MNRDDKATAVAEIGEELESAAAVFAVDYRGISVPQAAELRTRLREADASFTVVKNRLAKRATPDADATDLDEHLVGPTALTFVRGDAVLAAKAISDFAKQNDVLAFKGGIMEGVALDPEGFMKIARLPGVDVLRGQLVGMAASPLTGIVRTLNQLIAGLATQLGQVAEQGLVGGDAAPADAGDDEPAPDAEEADGGGGGPEANAPGGDQDDPPAGEPAGPDETVADEPEPPPGADDPDEPAADAPASSDEGSTQDSDDSDDSDKEN